MGNPTEAEAKVLALSNVPDSAPPPYTPCAGEAASSSSKCRSSSNPPQLPYQGSITMSDLAPYTAFPSILNAYYQIKVTFTYHLGNSDDHKIYAISNHPGLSKGGNRPYVVVHNGKSGDDPALAVVGEEKNWDGHSLTTVVSLPGIESGHVNELMQTIVMDDHATVVFRFWIEVNQPNTVPHREEFEWRKDNSAKMEDFKSTYQLVRLLPGNSDLEEKVDRSHDGFEIVAIAGWKKMWALKKPFSFRLIGKGQTGEYGDRWTIMALMTAIRLWCFSIQSRI